MCPAKKSKIQSNITVLAVVLTAVSLCGTAVAGPSVTVTLPSTATQANIQKALDELPAGGEVLLSPGKYDISQPLLLRHDCETLRGSGPSTILYLADGADCPVVVLGPPIFKSKHRAAHLRLADLMIDGNRKNQRLEFWRTASDGSEFNNNGVQIWNATDVTVEHVICCRCRSGGMVTASVRRLQVSDFDAYDNQYDGLACYLTEESHFNGLRLHDNLAAGISLDLAFNHNFITNAVLSDNDLGVFMRDSRNNSFQGLTILKSHHHGVFMAQAGAPTRAGWRLCPDTQCSGNNFENLLVYDCGGKAFLVNDASCTNNAILGATFLRNIMGGLGQPATNPVSFHEFAGR